MHVFLTFAPLHLVSRTDDRQPKGHKTRFISHPVRCCSHKAPSPRQEPRFAFSLLALHCPFAAMYHMNIIFMYICTVSHSALADLLGSGTNAFDDLAFTRERVLYVDPSYFDLVAKLRLRPWTRTTTTPFPRSRYLYTYSQCCLCYA